MAMPMGCHVYQMSMIFVIVIGLGQNYPLYLVGGVGTATEHSSSGLVLMRTLIM